MWWEQLECLEVQIAKLDTQIQEQVRTDEDTIALCATIPGIEAVAAPNLIAEIGVHMDQLPSVQHVASWAGVCPGNHESAGKLLSGMARAGHARWRRRLCQAPWVAS